jgi:endonuclease/exonuclease/phosphatase family metal-dependent hydrolase
LSRHPALSVTVTDLLGPLRNVLHARVDHPVGPIDVYSTHLASGSDLATSPCEGTFGPCPTECVAVGAATVRQCQAEQTALLVEATHDVPEPAFLVGDMNASPTSFEIGRFTGRGWIDTYAAAGNPACVPATGVGCTSGRSEAELEDPALNVGSRIDFVFLVPETGTACNGTLDTPADADGDGTGTRLFAEAPNPFAPPCGPLPDPICWVSDHSGVEADLDCH